MNNRFYLYPLRLLLLWLLSLPALSPVGYAQSIRYVKPLASGTGSGSSWANASGDLQSQINAPGVQQVWVAAGLYQPTSGRDRSISFAMKNGVALYGGFAGSETALNQRPGVNPLTGSPSSTTLSGDIGVAGNPSDNSYHVVNNPSWLDGTAILDGFVITGGRADGGDSSSNGGGMYNNSSSPSLSNCSFVGNSASIYGGGMFNYSISSPILSNCSFLSNSASAGGGIANYSNSNPSLSNCSFLSNSASDGGGMYNLNGSNPSLSNCSFVGNSASDFGGGMFIYYKSNPSLSNCSFVGNSASNGGGMYNNSSSPSLSNCVVFGNGAANTFYNNSGSITASYCLFEASVSGYTDGGHNLTTTRSPFLSATDARLNACSPAINAGNNGANTTPTDLAGNPRLYGGAIDLGAYEYQSAPATVAITSQPPSASSVLSGASVSASVSLTGSVSQYQWYKNGSLLNSQTSAALTLTSVQSSDAGRYTLVISGTCNSLTSTAFSLSVTPVRYVKQGGSGDGSSWTTASGDLQSQINAGGVQQVWVAAGTYQPAPGQYFALKEGVKVYGGFAPSGNPAFTDRNWTQYPTTLRGNGTHVVRNEQNGLTNAALLDGFTLTGGQAETGGGMLNNQAYPMINHCIFKDNRATIWGGGIYNLGPGTTTVANSLFVINSAHSGGAAFSYDRATPRFINVTLVANSATDNGGAVHNYQGAQTELINAIVWGNHQSAASSQLYTSGPGQMRVSYSLLEGGAEAIIGGKAVDNISSQDPLFGDLARGDYQLRACSPAINSGSGSVGTGELTTDLAGNPRLYGGAIDLGAYEYQAPGQVPTANLTASGELTCSNPVVTLTATPGSGFSYGFSAGATSVGTTNTARVTQAGTYSVVVTTSNGCSASASVTVRADMSLPRVSIQSSPSPIIEPGQSSHLTASGASSYRWSTGQTSSGISVNATGTYSVTGWVGACQATDSVGVVVRASGPSCGSYATRTRANGLPDDGVWGVYAQGRTVYVATHAGLSISTDGGQGFTTYSRTNGLASDIVQGVYAQEGTLYVATDGGLSISVDGGQHFTTRTTAQGLGHNTVTGVYAQGNRVYAITALGLSISTDGGQRFTNYATQSGLATTSVNGVYAQGSMVYAATSGGLSISTDGGQHFTTATTASGLGSDNVRGVYAQGSVVYVATSNGLSISTDWGQHFTTYSTETGLGSPSVLGVHAVGNTVYGATSGGLSISTDGGQHFTTCTRANGLGDNRVRSVWATASTIYAGTPSGLSMCSVAAPGARLAAAEPAAELGVKLLGNPVQGDELLFEVSGADGQLLQVVLTDLQGHLLQQQPLSSQPESEPYRLGLGGQPAGTYLLRVSTPRQGKTLRVIKAQ